MAPDGAADNRDLAKRIAARTGAALMHPLGKILLGIMLLIGGVVLWYKVTFPTYTYRYRMTVEVQVGNKIHSGSSVIEISIRKQPQFGDAPPFLPTTRGEAVFVDLGKGRNVIALLAAGPRAENVNYSDSIVPRFFGLSFKDQDLAKLRNLRGAREVPASDLPTFVTIADLADPKRARVVITGEFERVFGPDVHFKRAWIEMTNASVTRGIETKMPEIIRQLREQARSMQIIKVGDPYAARLGHFYIGG